MKRKYSEIAFCFMKKKKSREKEASERYERQKLYKSKIFLNGDKKMKEKEQIELAQEIIANAQDYIELAKVQRKLKVENVDQQIDNVTEFIKNNVKEL